MSLKRWLVAHRHSKGVLGVVWANDWYLGRAAAEAKHRDMPRDILALTQCPLMPGETEQKTFSVEKIARALHLQLGALAVTHADHSTGVITLGTPKELKKRVPWPKEKKKKKR